MTKICSKCGEEKELSEFYKDKKYKDGYRGQCKLCILDNCKIYEIKNKKKISHYAKEYRENNKDKIKAYYKDNKEHLLSRSRDYYNKNKQVIIKQKKIYRENNKDVISTKKNEYYIKNKKLISKKDKIYYNKNRQNIIRRSGEYQKNKILTDPIFKMQRNVRRRTLLAIEKGQGKKQGSTIELIGCSWEQVQEHLKSTMYGGMTWDDYLNGKVHIDHIIPISSFDLTTLEGQKKASHYTNLQLLWASDNLEKSDRLDWIHPRDRNYIKSESTPKLLP